MKTIKIRDTTFKIANLENENFWMKAMHGMWEPEIFEILSKFLTPQSVYLDIGTWIGPTLLYAAKHTRYCYGVEPDPKAFRILKENIEENKGMDYIRTWKGGIWDKDGILDFGSGLYGKALGDSASSVFTNNPNQIQVRMMTLESFMQVRGIKRIDFIKIDTEGAEIKILKSPYISDKLPTIDVSFHAGIYKEFGISQKEIDDVMDVVDKYKYRYVQDDRSHRFGDKITTWELRKQLKTKNTCDYVLSNEKIELNGP